MLVCISPVRLETTLGHQVHFSLRFDDGRVASLPKGSLSQGSKTVRVGDGNFFGGRGFVHQIWNWGQGSAGLSRECSLIRRTGRNSTRKPPSSWASEVSCRDCGALFDTARKLRDTPLNPLFPGYIFIVIDLSKQRWRSINGTFGVAPR